MICCALAALLIAAAGVWNSVTQNIRLRQTRWTAATLAAFFVAIGGTALAAHYRDRAAGGDLATLLLHHICGTPR